MTKTQQNLSGQARIAALLAALGLFAAIDAAAAQGAGTGPVATQCAADIKQYCATETHGAGAVRACLEAQKSNLTAQCQKALETTGGGRRGSASARAAGKGPVATQCAADIKQYCPNEPHRAGAVRGCLEAQKAKLTAQCQKALDTTGAGRGRSGAQ